MKMATPKTWLISLVISGLLTGQALAKRQRFDLRDAGQRNLVYFISEGTLEKTLGLSHALSGWIELDPEKLSEPVKGQLEMDVRTFDTGIDSLNAIVRGKMTGSPDYPLASLTVSRLLSSSRPALTDKQPVEVRLDGTLGFHGVTKTQSFLARLVFFKESESTRERLPGNLLKFSASTDLDMGAFGLEPGPGQEADLARYVQLFADAVGTDASPGAAPLATGLPADSGKVTKDATPGKKR